MFESYDLTLHCLDELARRGDAPEDVAKAFVPLLPDSVIKGAS